MFMEWIGGGMEPQNNMRRSVKDKARRRNWGKTTWFWNESRKLTKNYCAYRQLQSVNMRIFTLSIASPFLLSLLPKKTLWIKKKRKHECILQKHQTNTCTVMGRKISVSASQASFPLPSVENQELVVMDHSGEQAKKEETQNVTNHPTVEFNPLSKHLRY